MARKGGVAEPSEVRDFVAAAGDRLLIIDVRNSDANVEPCDQKSSAMAALPSDGNRLQVTHLIYDHTTESKPLPLVEDVDKKPRILLLEKNGYTVVMNGGGPKDMECWRQVNLLFEEKKEDGKVLSLVHLTLG